MRKDLKKKSLDGKLLYEQYFKMGDGASITRLARFAMSMGMSQGVKKTKINKDGLPFMSVWKAVWRWASVQENKTIAFQIFQEYVRNYGWEGDTDFPWPAGTEISWSDWHKFMIPKIKSAWQYKPNRHERFLRENGWM